jgi:hypothetical protein
MIPLISTMEQCKWPVKTLARVLLYKAFKKDVGILLQMKQHRFPGKRKQNKIYWSIPFGKRGSIKKIT